MVKRGAAGAQTVFVSNVGALHVHTYGVLRYILGPVVLSAIGKLGPERALGDGTATCKWLTNLKRKHKYPCLIRDCILTVVPVLSDSE